MPSKLPSSASARRVQSVKHLLLGCRAYQNERGAAGITRETTLHSLLFASGGTTMLRNFITPTKATRGWLLQGGSEGDRDDEWECGRLGESMAGNREAEGQDQSYASISVFRLSPFIYFPPPLLQVLSSDYPSAVDRSDKRIWTRKSDKPRDKRGGPHHIVSREKEETKERYRARGPQPVY